MHAPVSERVRGRSPPTALMRYGLSQRGATRRLRGWPARRTDAERHAPLTVRGGGDYGAGDEIRPRRHGRAVALDSRQVPEVTGVAVRVIGVQPIVLMEHDAGRRKRKREQQDDGPSRGPPRRHHPPIQEGKASRSQAPPPCRPGRSLLASKTDGRRTTRNHGFLATLRRWARLDRRPGAGPGGGHGRRGHLSRGSRGRSGLRGLPAPAPARRRTLRSPAGRFRGRPGAARTGGGRRMDRIRSFPPPARPRSSRVARSTRSRSHRRTAIASARASAFCLRASHLAAAADGACRVVRYRNHTSFLRIARCGSTRWVGALVPRSVRMAARRPFPPGGRPRAKRHRENGAS